MKLKVEFSLVPGQKRITVRLRRIFATTLTRRPVTTVFSTRHKEDTSATSWALSIATSVSEKNGHRRRSFQRSAGYFTKHEWSFFERYYTLYETWRPTSHAQSEFYGNLAKLGRKWFVHLHNFNSNSEYYINPVDGIKTNLVSSCQTLTFKGRSIAVEKRERKIQEEKIHQISPTQNENEFLLVPKNSAKARSKRLNGL